MTDSKVIQLNSPVADSLNEVLKQGARELLAKAVEAELAEMLEQYSELRVDGKNAVVRNGHLPERSIQRGLGDIPVKVPKVRCMRFELLSNLVYGRSCSTLFLI